MGSQHETILAARSVLIYRTAGLVHKLQTWGIEVFGARSLHAAEPFTSRAQIGAAACVVR